MDKKDKIKYLKDLIALSTVYSSLEGFVNGLKEMRQELIEEDEKESCATKIVEVLALMDNAQHGANVHRIFPARKPLALAMGRNRRVFLSYYTNYSFVVKSLFLGNYSHA